MNLGETIFRLRTAKGMSQGDLAEALEVSRQSISKWETNVSVPELDKLVKLSEVFGVTLDELVTGKAETTQDPAAAPEQTEPRIIYVEKPVRPSLSPAQILGIILLSCSLLCFVMFACFGDWYDLGVVFLLCLPVALWGVLCLVTKHPLSWCIWCSSLILLMYMLIITGRGVYSILFLVIGFLLVGGALLYTVYLHKKGRIRIPAWGWVLLTVALVSIMLILTISSLGISAGTVTGTEELTTDLDASIAPALPDSDTVAEVESASQVSPLGGMIIWVSILLGAGIVTLLYLLLFKKKRPR